MNYKQAIIEINNHCLFLNPLVGQGGLITNITPVTNQQNNKRIAKNTLMLYFRMILTMLVSLYTSRVVYDVKGVMNYGFDGKL